MATKRIKDLTNTAASVASDAYLAIDGTSNGTEKITRDNFRQDTADAFVAAPGTYNLAPLSGGAVEVAKGGTGATTAAGARTNLEVNSIGEDAQANALKTTAPALRFDGTSSVVTVADDDKFSFTDGTDDLPFSLSAWMKSDDLSVEGPIITRYGIGKEFIFYVQASDLVLALWDGTNNTETRTTSVITGYNGQWIHVAATYAGSGPNSDNAFTAAADGITLYINGVSQTITATNNASYTGIANTSEVLRLGARAGVFGESHLRDAKIFNRELTASEIAELARGNDLGFADEWGGTIATSGTLTVGKRYRLRDWITGDDFTNVGAGSNADGVEFVATGTTPTTWTNSSVVEAIGTLADFRAEDYNESASKLLDRSSNNFVGVGTSVTLTGNQRHISADTIDLKNLPTSSAGLSAGEVWSNGGVLTVV